MHLKAEEAVGLLNKIRWANTQPEERLVILQKIQKSLKEEMEDLGVEEAEMKNLKVGTTDNLYAADACLFTAVVPLAFCLSSAIELYKSNLASKPLNPVREERVLDISVDMIDFAAAKKSDENDEDENEDDNVANDAGDCGGKSNSSNNNNNNQDGLSGNNSDERRPFVIVPSDPPPMPPSEPPPLPPPSSHEHFHHGRIEDEHEQEERSNKNNTKGDAEMNDTDIGHDVEKEDGEMIQSIEDAGDKAAETKENVDRNDEQDFKTIPAAQGDLETSTTIPTGYHEVDNEKELHKSESQANDREVPENTKRREDAGRSIEIKFDPNDEFVKHAAEDYVPYYDVLVSPRTYCEKGYFARRQERLRTTGNPEQRVGPYDRRDPQATAILGSSCYSAAAEIIKATFFDGHVVVFKPHPYNEHVDRIWAEVMKPLIERGALSYCLPNQGPELVADPRIDQIYMTGSLETAAAIRKQTNKPCILQTGSVNPVIIVPGRNRSWGIKEIRHHALQIVSAGKFNGGHFCGRPQCIITSKSWDQRDVFLAELEAAITERTPPEASYDPRYREVFERFVHEYPEGKVIVAKNLQTDTANFFLATGASKNSYGLRHEAFCQVLIEVPLDVPDHPVAFLPEAVKFCNQVCFGKICDLR